MTIDATCRNCERLVKDCPYASGSRSEAAYQSCLEYTGENMRQAREGVLKAGREPMWAAVYAWLNDQKDAQFKYAVDRNGRLEREVGVLKTKLEAEYRRQDAAILSEVEVKEEVAGIRQMYLAIDEAPDSYRKLMNKIIDATQGEMASEVMDVLTNVLAMIATETGNETIVVDALRNCILVNAREAEFASAGKKSVQ